MKTCLKCGAQLEDDALFCNRCGFEDIKFCPKCGKSRQPGTLFCSGCGRKYYNGPAPEQESKTEEKTAPAAAAATAPAAVAAPVPAIEPVEPVKETVPVQEAVPFVAEPAVEIKPASEPVIEEEPISELIMFSEPEAPAPVVLQVPATPVPAPAVSDATIVSAPLNVPSQITDPVEIQPAAQPAKKNKIIIPVLIGGGVLVAAAAIAVAFAVTAPGRKYKQAVKLYEEGKYAEAAAEFEAAGDYQDAKKRAEEAATLHHYTNGKEAFDSGDFAKAKEEYEAAGDYKDAKTQAEQAGFAVHYTKGVALAESGDAGGAASEFKSAGNYKDAEEQLKKCYYKLGEDAAAGNDLENAVNYYSMAGDYENAAEKACEIYYKIAEKESAAGNLQNAAKNYTKAGKYKDAASKAKEANYTLGENALNKKEYDNAIAFFKEAGDYNNAKAKIKQAYYKKAVDYLNHNDYANAASSLRLAGDYKDARTLLINTISKLVKAEKYDTAKQVIADYTGNDAGVWGKYIDGMIAYNEKKYNVAAVNFREVGNFLNAKDLYKASKYLQGVGLLIDGSYPEARSCFKECGNYKFAKDLVNVADAEKQYDTGKLSKAAQLYNKVSKKTKITGFDVQGRKTHVNAKLTLEKVKGNWTAKSNNLKVKHVEADKSWRDWHNIGLWTNQTMKISYTENANGTFNITGEVAFWRYTNYSYYKYNLTYERHVIYFNFKNQKKLPTKVKLEKYVTLKYSKGTFTVVYSKNEKDGSATNQFRSTVAYKKIS